MRAGRKPCHERLELHKGAGAPNPTLTCRSQRFWTQVTRSATRFESRPTFAADEPARRRADAFTATEKCSVMPPVSTTWGELRHDPASSLA